MASFLEHLVLGWQKKKHFFEKANFSRLKWIKPA